MDNSLIDTGVKAMRKVLRYCWYTRHHLGTTDLTFKCARGIVKAHRFIVSIGNPWLYKLLKESGDDGNAVIYLPNVSSEILVQALKLLYINFEGDKLDEILTGGEGTIVNLALHENYLQDEESYKAPISVRRNAKRIANEPLFQPKIKLVKLSTPPPNIKVINVQTIVKKKPALQLIPLNEKGDFNFDDVIETFELHDYKECDTTNDSDTDTDPEIEDNLANAELQTIQNKVCNICKQDNFSDKEAVIQHKKMEHGYTFYSCDHCGFEVRSRSDIVEHKKQCLPDGFPNRLDGRSVNCSLCVTKGIIASFKTPRQIQTHLASDHPQELIQQNVCPFKDCNETKNLLKHVIDKHHEFIYTCPACIKVGKLSRIYRTARAFDNHWDIVHVGKKYRCLVCNNEKPVTFNESQLLSNHLAAKHRCNLMDFTDDALLKQVVIPPGPVTTVIVEESGGYKVEDDFDLKENAERQVERLKTKVNGKIFFKCDICEIATTSRKVMTLHKLVCNEKAKTETAEEMKFWPCDICSEQFTSEKDFSQHKRKVHCAQYYVCTTCSEKPEFYKKSEIMEHKKVCVPNFNPGIFAVLNSHYIPCKFQNCDVVENYMDSLRLHIAEVHLGAENEKCPLCEFKSQNQNRSELLDHIEVQHHSTMYKCPGCPVGKAIFNSTCNLRNHFNEKHYDMRYRCSHCKFTSGTRKSLIYHVRYVHDGTIERATCPYCGTNLRSDRSLQSHLKIYHSDDVDVPCNICGQVFPNKAKLHHHKTAHHRATRPGKKACPECGVMVTNVTNHMERLHTQTDPVECFYCNKICAQVHSLHKHIRKAHKMNDSMRSIRERLSMY